MVIRQNIPNLLTFGRVLAVPLCLLIILFPPIAHTALFLIFLAAAITDFLDGYLARQWNVVSPLGALLDPIADKLLVAVLLLYFAVFYGVSLLPVAAMILREIYISGLREFLAGRQVQLPVSKGGKLKTSLQLASISLMLFAAAFFDMNRFSGSMLFGIGQMLLWVAALVSVATAVQYTRDSWQHLR